MEAQWKSEPDLVAAYAALRQKITLLAITELVFQSPSRDRGLAFAEIAAAAQLPHEHVRRARCRQVCSCRPRRWRCC